MAMAGMSRCQSALIEDALRRGLRNSWHRVCSAGSGVGSLRRHASSSAEENDVVVVGGGPGGYVAAIKAAQLGFKTTCIEKRGALGGTCLNVGCIPSKALLQSSHMFHEAKHSFAGHGVKVGQLEIDVSAMMAQKMKAVTGLTKGIEGLFKKNKVTYVKGAGKIVSGSEVSVDLVDGGNSTVKGKHIIIATGSEVKPLPGINIDENKIVSSTGALSLKEVPKKLVVIGAGYIGLEMGSVWGRLGSEVTVVEFGSDIVPSMDWEIRKSFQKTLEKLILKTKVTGVDASGPGVKLTQEPASGGEQTTFEADVATTVSGDPFAASINVSDDLFSGAVPNSSNAGDPFSDLSFGATAGRNGDPQFVDPLTSFACSTKAPAKAVDPFEALNKSFTSQKQVTQAKSKDPLNSLFTSSSTGSQRGFTSQPLSETDDWGLDGDFGGADTGLTTELEGLPPPPAGVNISIVKDKGMESYKQGQFAEAIKWLSWATVLLEKGGKDYGVSAEVLTCRASC